MIHLLTLQILIIVSDSFLNVCVRLLFSIVYFIIPSAWIWISFSKLCSWEELLCLGWRSYKFWGSCSPRWGRPERQIDRWIAGSSAGMLYWSVVVKRAQGIKKKFSFYQSVDLNSYASHMAVSWGYWGWKPRKLASTEGCLGSARKELAEVVRAPGSNAWVNFCVSALLVGNCRTEPRHEERRHILAGLVRPRDPI